jgi:hypothetical protein
VLHVHRYNCVVCIYVYMYELQVVDGVKLAYLYVRYGRFWVDLLSVVPFIYLVSTATQLSHCNHCIASAPYLGCAAVHIPM